MLPESPIAIVGIGCRFPKADNPHQFWDNLVAGKDCTTNFAYARPEWLPFVDAGNKEKGKTYCDTGGFLIDADSFDASFFSIPKEEAERMDPQQGLILETVWQALECAKILPFSLEGSNTGVFIGASTRDFDRLFSEKVFYNNSKTTTGASGSIISNRVSYVFGLTGPSLTVDSACSSSLASVHLAVQSLQLKECDIALAGGVQLVLSPANILAYSQDNILSSDGKCKSFSEKADGFCCGEGAGVVVLKRLDDALREGDNILAEIHGSALNHNGLSNGLSAPYGKAQQKLINRALQVANFDFSTIDYIEAHSAGTYLGDLIEVGALKRIGSNNELRNSGPCFIGSVKSNIGHLEAAAGIASLIKTILIVNKKYVTPSIHCDPENKELKLDGSSIRIASNGVDLSYKDEPVRAGVSSFNFGGANAHLVIQGHNSNKALSSLSSGFLLTPEVLLISGPDKGACLTQLRLYKEHLVKIKDRNDLRDLCHASACCRHHHKIRLAISAGSKQEAVGSISNAIQLFSRNNEIKGYQSSDFLFVANKVERNFSSLFLNGLWKEIVEIDFGKKENKETIETISTVYLIMALGLIPDFFLFSDRVSLDEAREYLYSDKEDILLAVFSKRFPRSKIDKGDILARLKLIECDESKVKPTNITELIEAFFVSGKPVDWELMYGKANSDIEIPFYQFDRVRNYSGDGLFSFFGK